MTIQKSVSDAEVTFSVSDSNSVTRSDVITGVNYICQVTTGSQTLGISTWVSLNTSDLSTFTAFSELTQSQVVTMCENILGSTRVAEIEANLNAQKAEYENPTKEIRQISS